jgi:lysophospholipase L1-like esterase
MGANGTFTPKAETMPVVAVVGDSISGMHGESGYGFMLAKALGMRLLNASVIGGTASTTYGFAPGVERIGSVAAVNPDIMVIALGTNDLIRKVPLADFTRDYAAMVSSVVRTTPGTRVYLMGLFPGAGTREMVAAYNTAIRAVAASSHAGYLDAENLVSPSLFQDTLHPGKDAQRRIADALLQLIGKGTK